MSFILFDDSDHPEENPILCCNIGEHFNEEEVIMWYFEHVMTQEKMNIKITGSEIDYLIQYIPFSKKNMNIIEITGNHYNTMNMINLMYESRFPECTFVVA